MAENSNNSRNLVVNKGHLVSRNIQTELELYYYLFPEQVTKAFRDVGIIIDKPSEDFKLLAQLSKSGGDKLGALRNKQGTPIIFDTRKVLYSIEVYMDPAKLKNVTFTD